MSDKAQRLAAIAQEIRTHRPCGFECCEAATNLVPGEGDPDAAIVVPLGRHALRRFAPELKLGEVHGQPVEAGGLRLFPLYHPAAALHNGGLRATLREDARRLGEHLR